jgi:hypothetical protein
VVISLQAKLLHWGPHLLCRLSLSKQRNCHTNQGALENPCGTQSLIRVQIPTRC